MIRRRNSEDLILYTVIMARMMRIHNTLSESDF